MSDEPKKPKRPRKPRRRISPWWSLAFGLILHLIYSFRIDMTYAITAWPAWIGASFGILLALISKKWIGRVMIFWLYFGIVFVDEVKTYPRMILPAPQHDIRVASLNCAGGIYAAAMEVKSQNPDIVFFQESCNSAELKKLAHEFYGDQGSYIDGPDATIIARGKLEKRSSKRVLDYVAATWTDPKGRKLNVVSLRLTPPSMRIDLYDPSAWQSFAENRSTRRTEVQRIADELKQLNFQPDLLGGDFNTPPDSEVQAHITIGLADSFARAGVGYGATCVNPYPCLVRIDQIWSSMKLNPTRSKVVATENSDHRMLISDFQRNP